MKPMLFKSQKDLIKFIENLPRPEGKAKVGDKMLEASAMLNQCAELAPKIFEYKHLLAKGPGGVGNHKNVDKYVGAALDNVSKEKMAEYDLAIAALATEIEELINYGASEELADKMQSAKTAVARLRLMKESILGFKLKLHKVMARVEASYIVARASMNKVVATNKDKTIAAGLETALSEMNRMHKNVGEVVHAMDRYCDLQVGYNSILIGAAA